MYVSRTWRSLQRFLKIYVLYTCEPRKLRMRSLSNALPRGRYSPRHHRQPNFANRYSPERFCWGRKYSREPVIGLWVLGCGVWDEMASDGVQKTSDVMVKALENENIE
jgi:hypothetical protein